MSEEKNDVVMMVERERQKTRKTEMGKDAMLLLPTGYYRIIIIIIIKYYIKY